ncbi:MAG: energy transducer TonB [Lishizhenia sp.]
MIAKKNAKIDLEKNRFAYLQIGLLVAGGLMLTAFTWRNPLTVAEQLKRSQDKADIPIEIVQHNPEQLKEEPVVQHQQNTAITLDLLDENQTEVQNQNTQSQTAVSSTITLGKPTLGNNFNLSLGAKPAVDLGASRFPDVEAQFIGGKTELFKFIKNKVEYPEMARQFGVQGKVYVEFIVEKDGSVTNIKVVHSVDKDLDREAKRVVRSFPNWIPGIKDGEKVRTYVRQPINFRLE